MKNLTGIIEKEGDWYVAFCPELNVASQGETIAAARANLLEALELFFECADDEEIARRLKRESYAPPLAGIVERLAQDGEIDRQLGGELYITPLEVAHG